VADSEFSKSDGGRSWDLRQTAKGCVYEHTIPFLFSVAFGEIRNKEKWRVRRYEGKGLFSALKARVVLHSARPEKG
jgi:hypothetical protein